MENLVVILIIALFTVAIVRLMLLPMKLTFKLGLHSGAGLICLWLLNSISPFTGIFFPVNAVTVLVSGFLGLPGIGLMALLSLM